MKILMLHGINHNMFGKRDPKQYGTITLAQIDAQLQALGKELGAEVESYQTNDEGKMCERIHQAYSEGKEAVLINAGAWTHYSYGIRDALAILTCPVVEAHMSTSTRARSFATNRCLSRLSKARSAVLAGTAICWRCERLCPPQRP